MRYRGCRAMAAWATAAAAGFCAATVAKAAGEPAAPAAAAVTSDSSRPNRPLRLSLLQDAETAYPPTIYAPLVPPREDEGVNQGGVNLSLTVNYMTDYVYRGIDRSETGGAEDAPNLQFDGQIKFNLGRLPHPVVGVFVNVYNDDPISRFQEVRPFVGFDWNLKPLTVSAGHITYIFPEREDQNTSEVYLKVRLDDSRLFRSDRPVLNPYVFAAYDYDRYDGLYVEAGLRHDIPIEDTGIVVSAVADVAYVLNHGDFSRTGTQDTGFQHYEVGVIGSYSLNTLLNLSRRYGHWSLKGYLYYTDGIDNELRSDSQLWGGVGVTFDY